VGRGASGVAVAGLGAAACGAEQANIAAVTRNADKSSRVLLSLLMIVLLTQFTVEVPYSGPNSLGTILAVTGNISRFKSSSMLLVALNQLAARRVAVTPILTSR